MKNAKNAIAPGLAVTRTQRLPGRRVCLILSAAGLLAVAACQSPPAEQFSSFAEATKKVEQDIDKVVSDLADQTSARFVNEAMAQPERVLGMKLAHAPLPSAGAEQTAASGGVPATTSGRATPASNMPTAATLDRQRPYFQIAKGDGELYVKVLAFRSGLLSFNRGISGYADLLKQLAAPDLIDGKALDQAAGTVNGNLRSARDLFDLKSVQNDDIALFTTAGVELFRAYLSAKQRDSLLTAMRSVDARFADTARGGQEACALIAESLWNEYDAAFNRLANPAMGLGTRDNPAVPSEAQRRQAITSIVQLNTQLSRTLAVLDALHQAYGHLPAAHAALIAATRQGPTSLPDLSGLLSEVARIDALYESLKK